MRNAPHGALAQTGQVDTSVPDTPRQSREAHSAGGDPR
jgi:hypothetical protein